MKLTRQLFNDIKKRQKLPAQKLASAFNVSQSTVAKIKKAKSFLDYKRRYVTPQRNARIAAETKARTALLCAAIAVLIFLMILLMIWS